jgi:hypothetical protein
VVARRHTLYIHSVFFTRERNSHRLNHIYLCPGQLAHVVIDGKSNMENRNGLTEGGGGGGRIGTIGRVNTGRAL